MVAGREGVAIEAAREPRFPRVQIAVGSLGFVGLTVAVFWYQFAGVPGGEQALAWSSLRWRYLALLLLCLPVESVASALRIWLLCRVLEPGMGLWTCFKAEWANVAIAMLTPSQSGGGPGQIYMLSRGGARVGTALTVLLLVFQMAFFLAFPVVTPESWRSANRARTCSERFLALVQRFDARSNSFPSMHTSVAMLTALHLYPSLGAWSLAFPALIGLSCLFTKQHYVVDVPAGAALGWAAFQVFRVVG